MYKHLEANKAVVRRWIDEVWNQGHLDVADALHPATGSTSQPIDSTSVKHTARFWRAAFPDLQITIEDLIAEGDRVVCRLTFRGTPQGEWVRGLENNTPPASTPVVFTGSIICRIAGGKIVQIWFAYDELGLLQQLGIIPPKSGL